MYNCFYIYIHINTLYHIHTFIILLLLTHKMIHSILNKTNIFVEQSLNFYYLTLHNVIKSKNHKSWLVKNVRDLRAYAKSHRCCPSKKKKEKKKLYVFQIRKLYIFRDPGIYWLYSDVTSGRGRSTIVRWGCIYMLCVHLSNEYICCVLGNGTIATAKWRIPAELYIN